MTNRSKDWLSQAERDLERAKAARNVNHHEWASFSTRQAAEKAAEALHLSQGQEGWGHVVSRLLSELPVPVVSTLAEKGKVLDNAYIPSR